MVEQTKGKKDKLLGGIGVLKDLTVDQLQKLKTAILAVKQGEAIERGSTPLTHDEALSLGFYGGEAAYALALLELTSDTINNLMGSKGNFVKYFTETFARATGSRQGKRLELTLNTVGTIGQFNPSEGMNQFDMVEEDEMPEE